MKLKAGFFSRRRSLWSRWGSTKGRSRRLKRAAATAGGKKEPRFLCVLRFNLAVNLCHLGRHAEAEKLLPDIRSLAVRLGNGLDLVRALWLEGRIAAGLGQRDQAVSALERVRADFMSRGMAYDVALATLELAVLFLEEGKGRKGPGSVPPDGADLQVAGSPP